MKLKRAIHDYCMGHRFSSLSDATKGSYYRALYTLDEWGDREIDSFIRPDIVAIRDKLSAKPGRCRMVLAVLSNVFSHAMDRGWCQGNPASGVTVAAVQKPYARWTEAELDNFLTNAEEHLKRALLLALYTGQRRSDLIRMRWHDYNDGMIYVKQMKTGKELFIPVHPRLEEQLTIWKSHWATLAGDTILHNRKGEPWSGEQLRAAISRQAKALGIHDRSIHGVRKSTASMLAEAGCTAHEIMSITGHDTMKEISRYTKEAEQKKMAREAMAKWKKT